MLHFIVLCIVLVYIDMYIDSLGKKDNNDACECPKGHEKRERSERLWDIGID